MLKVRHGDMSKLQPIYYSVGILRISSLIDNGAFIIYLEGGAMIILRGESLFFPKYYDLGRGGCETFQRK